MTDSWAKKITKENLSGVAYSSIRYALMHAQLAPGTRLLLRDMAKKFGISATPMREALMQLVSEGALELDTRGTAIVPHLTSEELTEIRSIRVLLEGQCASKAAQMTGDAKVQELREIHDQIMVAIDAGRFADAINLNTSFHLTLCRISGQKVTFEIVERLWVRCGPILSHLYDDGIPVYDGDHPHLRVIQAISAGNARDAKRFIVDDIRGLGRSLDRYVAAEKPLS